MKTSGLTITKVKKDFEKKNYSPEELLHAVYTVIEEEDKKYHVFVSLTNEQAYKSLEKANVKDELAGIPGSIKDNYNWIGTKTTASSNILKNYISPYNATVTQKLLDESACLVGKTNLDAFAHGSSTETSDFFTTLNPYDIKHVAGGSSGGAAAAVALGMGVYALGSETAGSVRGPAAWCGVVGFAPTYGRISRYGLIAMGSSLDRPGVLTNSVEDAAILMDILSGEDPRDATSINEPALKLQKNMSADFDGLRIGIPSQYFDDRINTEVLERVQKWLKEMEKRGAKLVEIELMDPKYSMAVYTIVQRSEVSSNLARIDGIRYGYRSEKNAENVLDQIAYNRGEGFGHEAKQRSITGAYTLSAGYYDAYYKKAQKVRTLIINDFNKAFEDVDVIAGPTMPTTAPEVGVTKGNALFGELTDILTEPSALAGLPCISVPVGEDKAGLPIGMQFFGKQLDEQRVINTGYALEKLITEIS